MCAKNTSKSAGSGRTRNYRTVVYPESAPIDWVDILISCFVPAFISPLHDKDVNPGGEPKKPHYHVIIMFDSVKTKDQAKEIFDKIGGVGCEVIASIRGYARYLCHLDNPEKAQYNTEEVKSICGADYNTVCSLVTDKYRVIEEMIDWCVENECFSYVSLMLYAKSERRDWFRSLCDNSTVVMKEFLKSMKWDIDQANRKRLYEENQKAMAALEEKSKCMK
ncbi:MAG: replication protein [Oscillospiraceae bacterium]|nr:replication protein [Oscillospiraceae bacterium]